MARLVDRRWIACAILNESDVALDVGGELDFDSTICKEIQRQTKPVAVDDFEQDPVYCRHAFFQRYPFRSYVGEYCTSLDMAGASVTLVKLDDELNRLFDAPAEVAVRVF